MKILDKKQTLFCFMIKLSQIVNDDIGQKKYKIVLKAK